MVISSTLIGRHTFWPTTWHLALLLAQSYIIPREPWLYLQGVPRYIDCTCQPILRVRYLRTKCFVHVLAGSSREINMRTYLSIPHFFSKEPRRIDGRSSPMPSQSQRQQTPRSVRVIWVIFVVLPLSRVEHSVTACLGCSSNAKRIQREELRNEPAPPSPK